MQSPRIDRTSYLLSGSDSDYQTRSTVPSGEDGNRVGQSERTSKSVAADALMDALGQRQFDLVAVSSIRRRHCGDLGLTSGAYGSLLQVHARPFASLDPTEIRSLTKLLFTYFDWSDAVLKHRLADAIRR